MKHEPTTSFAPHASDRRAAFYRETGFTLIELVLAVALLGGAFMGLLFLRTSAISQASKYNMDRRVQRIAQEKLDEVIYGLEQNQSGSIEEEPDWNWEIDVFSLATVDTLFPLLECTLTLRYPGESSDAQEEYVLATRFFADEQHALYEFAENLNEEP